MAIRNNYTPTGYVPTSTLSAPTGTADTTVSGNVTTSSAAPTGTSNVTTRTSVTYTAQAPETNAANPKETKKQSSKNSTTKTGDVTTSPEATPRVSSTPTPTITVDPFAMTYTDPVTGRATTVDVRYSPTPNPFTSDNPFNFEYDKGLKLPECFNGLQDIVDWYENCPIEITGKQLTFHWQTSAGKQSLTIGEFVTKFPNKTLENNPFKDLLKGCAITWTLNF